MLLEDSEYQQMLADLVILKVLEMLEDLVELSLPEVVEGQEALEDLAA